MGLIRFASWADKSNVLFHLEANGSSLATYGSYTGQLKAYDVVIDTVHTLDDIPLIMAKPEVNKAYIILTDNLFNGIDNKFTITYKIFVSDIKDNAIIYPFSGCVYDIEYKDYVFENCRPIHEFRLEHNVFCYKTSNYMAGMLKKKAFPQNQWVFVTLCVDCTNNTQIRLYINGELMSLGYATSESSNLENDIWEICRSLQNRIELPGLSCANYYALAEFTIYKDCPEIVQSFRPPEMSTHRMLNLTTTSIVSSLDTYKTTAFIDSGDTGKFIPNFGSVPEVEIPVSYDRQMTRIAYFGDEWSRGKWTEMVSDLCGMETVAREFIEHASSQTILNSVDSALSSKPDIIVITCGYYDEDVKSAMYYINQIVEKAYNNGVIPIIVGYTRTHDKTKYLNELHKALTAYWYSSERPPVFYYINTYANKDLVLTLNEESHNLDDVHLSDIGEFEYASMIVTTIEEAVHYEKFYRYPRSGYLDINMMMSVLVKESRETRIVDCRLVVTKDTTIKTKTITKLDIPWPYPLIKEDTPFILLDHQGKLVPSSKYSISSNKKTLTFTSSYTIYEDEYFTFVFVHKHGLCNVKKIEKVYALSNTRNYNFPNPFNGIVDLKERTQVYCNSELLDKSLYTFNNNSGLLTLSESAPSTGTLVIICFYTENISIDKAISCLPQSGYFQFARNKVDRVWDKDLYAVFVNGKLLSKDKIMDMNSYTHKVTEDIKSRYGLEVLNMSPRIPDLVPFFKMKNNDNYYYNVKGQDLYCTMNVKYPSLYHPRHYLHSCTFNPLIDLRPEYYITLVHKKTTKNINYSLRFYFDCYQEKPSQVDIVGQVKTIGSDVEFDEDREGQLLIYKLPIELVNVEEDTPLCSVQVNDIYGADTIEGNGVMLRMEVYKQKIDKWTRLHYELDTDDYEHGTEVYVLEWVISTGRNATGSILYRKSVGFTSYETPNFIE